MEMRQCYELCDATVLHGSASLLRGNFRTIDTNTKLFHGMLLVSCMSAQTFLRNTRLNLHNLLFSKGPHRPDAIRQRDANFQFSKTNKNVNG